MSRSKVFFSQLDINCDNLYNYVQEKTYCVLMYEVLRLCTVFDSNLRISKNKKKYNSSRAIDLFLNFCQ